jgi:hypothetical protein
MSPQQILNKQYTVPPLSAASVSLVLVTYGTENTKWKIPEIIHNF